MKKIITVVLAAMAVASCNLINDDPDEPINYNALYCICKSQAGENLSKTVFVENSDTKAVQEDYVYENNDWVLDIKTVTERTFDVMGNIASAKYSYYDAAGVLDLVDELRYENVYTGSQLSECYMEKLNEEGEWEKSQRLNLVYVPGQNLVSDIVYSDYNAETEKYDIARMRTYSYYNGYVVAYENAVFVEETETWTVISECAYGYDEYNRLRTITTVDRRESSNSTVVTYYY